MNRDFNTLDSFEFEALRLAHNYKDWICSQFAPILTQSSTILEIGAGIGQFTQTIQRLTPTAKITALEPCAAFYQTLTSTLPDIESINAYSNEIIGTQTFDSIININVLEHIKNDQQEIEHWNQLLKPGGRVCILVPACEEIYAPIDNSMGHYRRYSKKSLAAKFTQSGFEIETIEYFNFLGYWLWMLNFKLLKNLSFSDTKVAFNDKVLIHLSKSLDFLGANKIKGQSVICIARKL